MKVEFIHEGRIYKASIIVEHVDDRCETVPYEVVELAKKILLDKENVYETLMSGDDGDFADDT